MKKTEYIKPEIDIFKLQLEEGFLKDSVTDGGGVSGEPTDEFE